MSRILASLILLCALALSGTAIAANGPDLPDGWHRWSVPASEEASLGCCIDREDGICMLDGAHSWSSERDRTNASGRAVIAVRVADRRLAEALALHPDCPLGTRSGAAPAEVASVSANDSIAWLSEAFVDGGRKQRSGMLHALSVHADAEVDRRFRDWLEAGALDGERQQDILFWSALSRGKQGLENIDRVLAGKDSRLRSHAAFVLTQSPVDGAAERLLPLANSDADPEVRRQALFWLAQSGQAGAADALKRAMREDPDSGVREHAVFALSQLDDGTGLDHLLAMVRDASVDADLRRKALFWLAQSEDPRATAALETSLGLAD